MKHLTKDINQLGRAIAARVLHATSDFEFNDDDEFGTAFFVTCKYKGRPAAIKILAKASSTRFGGIKCFQMDEVVIEKIETYVRVTNRLMVIALVDTRDGDVLISSYSNLSNGYIDEGVNFPMREPSTKDGPVWWNSCARLMNIGKMSNTERDRLIVLRTKNKADKMQKSIFDK